METILLGLGTTAAAMVTLTNAMGWRMIAKHSTKVDVGLTLVYLFVFAGTSTAGVFTAMWAGLFTAIATKIIKKTYVYLADHGRAKPLVDPYKIDYGATTTDELKAHTLNLIFGRNHHN